MFYCTILNERKYLLLHKHQNAVYVGINRIQEDESRFIEEEETNEKDKENIPFKFKTNAGTCQLPMAHTHISLK